MNIFITGGTTGIGLSLAQGYLQKGHRVAICGRNLNKLPKGHSDLYPNLKTYQLDVNDRKELEKSVKDFIGEKQLDLMIANAGIVMKKNSRVPNFEEARKVIDTNLYGVLNSFEVALKYMIPQKKGHIVAVSSVAGMVGLPNHAAYCASKAAVLKLCETFSIDFKPLGIDVTAIAPGFIDTPLTQNNKHYMPFLMTSKKASKLIIKAIEKKMPLFVFPRGMQILMFVLERLPRFLYRLPMNMKIYNMGQEN